MTQAVGIVVIGRNEGVRLIACLEALQGQGLNIVYVDSGSTDNSVAEAKARGADIVALDMSLPFTAARARNAGLDCLDAYETIEFVQFLDGDCVIQPGWLSAGEAFLREKPEIAIVTGRLRERFPEKSIYNRMCDHEWDEPIGKIEVCAGLSMMRRAALTEECRFNPNVIAGEDDELSVRIRAAGWEIWRLKNEMALHDAEIYRFSQFWRRMRRGGYACAEGAHMHGAPPARLGVQQQRRALIWGGLLPLVILLGTVLFGSWALPLLLVYPAQIIRLALRDGAGRTAWERAALMTVSKFAEVQGVFEFHIGRLWGRGAQIIEYK